MVMATMRNGKVSIQTLLKEEADEISALQGKIYVPQVLTSVQMRKKPKKPKRKKK